MGENMDRLSPMKSTHSWLKTYINARTGRTTLRITCIKYPYECQYSRAIPCMTSCSSRTRIRIRIPGIWALEPVFSQALQVILMHPEF